MQLGAQAFSNSNFAIPRQQYAVSSGQEDYAGKQMHVTTGRVLPRALFPSAVWVMLFFKGQITVSVINRGIES